MPLPRRRLEVAEVARVARARPERVYQQAGERQIGEVGEAWSSRFVWIRCLKMVRTQQQLEAPERLDHGAESAEDGRAREPDEARRAQMGEKLRLFIFVSPGSKVFVYYENYRNFLDTTCCTGAR